MRAAAAIIALALATGAEMPAAADGLVSRRVVTSEMARCAVRRDPSAARRFVLADFPTDSGEMSSELKAARARITQTLVPCLGPNFRSVTMTGIVLRGFLSEGLLTENEAILLDQVRQLPAVQPVPLRNSDHSGAAFWTCVTGAQPRPSAELISAPDGSPAEQLAFDALTVAMRGCAPADGTLHVKPENVRPQVAAALYRRLAGPTSSGRN